MTERWRRPAAVAAIVLLALVVLTSLVGFVDDLRRLLIDVPLLLIALVAAWHALTRTGVQRLIAIVVCVAALGGVVAVALDEGGPTAIGLLARVAMLLAAVGLARFALARDIRSLRASATPGRPVPPARHGALLLNLRSGGGKAERFHLVDECRRRRIEPIVLRPGDDMLRLARDAIENGADVIGVAGGDGSQALVATVAAETGTPMVVVPAGTRNHLALDLGLDREDVVGALDAFGDAVERPMDLASVNGRAFVNNVSLGLYAAIIRSPDYRDAKVETTLATVPRVLGPGTQAFDLRFTGPRGEFHEQADLIQVSNNPYGERAVGAAGSRPRLDTGRLGVVALTLGRDRRARAFLGALAAGHPERFDGFSSWTTETFTVTSDAPIDVGLDGEAVSMEPPLTFTIGERSLRVRLPTHAIGYSPAARRLGWRPAGRHLWRTAIGRDGGAMAAEAGTPAHAS
jgi:diacylglycerol kinase family enzyme